MSKSKLINLGLCTMIVGAAVVMSPVSAHADAANNISAGVSSVLFTTLSNEIDQSGVNAASDETENTTDETEDNTFYGYTNLGMAKIDSGALNVRRGSDESHSLVGKMKKGTACEILGEKNGWYKIKSGKVEGWVKSDYILTGDDAYDYAEKFVSTIAVVNTTTLNVREKPSTDSAIWYLVPIDEELEVTEDLGDWIEVSIDDDKVYVSSEFVDLKQELPTALTLSEANYGEGVSDAKVSLVNYALQFVGNPYVWGGTSLTNGADCSGFVMSIYAKYGVSLPHSSRAQAGYGTAVSASEAQPGDLFFYGNGSTIGHVAIYIGNGQIVHASNHRDGIKVSNAFYRTPICVRRLL